MKGLVCLSLIIGACCAVSVSGPLVDLYCWDDRNGFALDTGANLKVSRVGAQDEALLTTRRCRLSTTLCIA